MPLLGRIFAGDEELGKKDDDHKRRKGHILSPLWTFRPAVLALRKRRLFYGVVSLLLLYLLLQNAPLHQRFYSPRWGSWFSGKHQSVLYGIVPAGPPPRSQIPSKIEEHYYDGRIKFYNLAVSLSGLMGLGRHNRVNRHVLFAASDLRSASEIVPLACEMARWKRNTVHLALMGREDLNISDVKDLNGISDEHCSISWHDARPDYSRWSSDSRMEMSVSAGLKHIQTYIEPRVIITGHVSREDGFFIRAVRAKALDIGISLIELPLDATENLMWLARLDSGSLAAWQTVYVDIVIHAPPKSSGSLVRLLKSIEAADYFGGRRPHLTIELPAEVDSPTSGFLENLVWPPIDQSGGSHASQVTLRHRLPRYRFTTEEASTHFIESFYPARPKDSHVLLLSPQVELSPLYYHYVLYNILHYKYATYARLTDATKALMGFSLEQPSVYLNNSAGLEPPMLEALSETEGESKIREHTPFLWQAPNSNAALYFGDKWVELHSFLSARIASRNLHHASEHKPPSRQKIVSEYYPSWMEYVQELMRTRGYSLLYPHFPVKSDALVTIHNELYQLPEEFSPTHPDFSSNPVPAVDPYDPFIVDSSAHTPSFATHQESPLLTTKLLALLPEFGPSILLDLASLPILSHDGNLISSSISESIAKTFADDFRREIGRCGGNEPIIHYHMSANDLFCHSDLHDGLPTDYSAEKQRNKKNEQVPPREIIGSPLQYPPKPAESTVKTLANEGKEIDHEFAAHLGRQNPKFGLDQDKAMTFEDDEFETEASDLEPESRVTAKMSDLKANVQTVMEDDNSKTIDIKEIALKEDKETGKPISQSSRSSSTPPDSQGSLQFSTETSTPRPITPASLSLNAPAESALGYIEADFVQPVIRHPGW